ncbi:PEP-CTERM sorting domain-containing protein [Luteolibacter pohnpeiensis]|uniref:PEP-CTERM sorting domain-containing protein n=1 Tax=Luteolibacter pohnpeiensis TaxID=454153 RepID=A0A934S6M0_9BACT|nr:LamG-like jellyroll fold domain-containing protein [Luteolibacter pohnpeiensis]MBK1884050.1 PEP-CTERM sorting domain-containing protein [Luteolibacter pohnpeiensis]
MRPIIFSSLLAGLLVQGTASAAINVIAYYRMGEDGTLTNGSAVDSSGNGNDILNAVNATGITVSTSDPAPGSTAYYTFDGSTQGFYSSNFAPDDNFGIEAWVKVGDLMQGNTTIFSTGGNDGGLQLSFDNGSLAGALASSSFVGDAYTPSSTDEWVHLALVRADGVTTYYVNGVAYGDSTSAGINSASTIHLGVSSGASAYFNGSIDEARIFTFDSGAFSTSDLLAVPEPSIALLGLFGFGGMLFARRRSA